MEKKRVISPDNVFAEMPFLKAYFKDMDGKIRHLRGQEGKEEELENLKKKRKALYEMAKYMGSDELQVLYYIRQIKGLDAYHVLTALKKLYLAQEEFYKLIKEGELPQIH